MEIVGLTSPEITQKYIIIFAPSIALACLLVHLVALHNRTYIDFWVQIECAGPTADFCMSTGFLCACSFMCAHMPKVKESHLNPSQTNWNR